MCDEDRNNIDGGADVDRGEGATERTGSHGWSDLIDPVLVNRAVTFGIRAAALAGLVTTVGATVAGSGVGDVTGITYTTCCPDS